MATVAGGGTGDPFGEAGQVPPLLARPDPERAREGSRQFLLAQAGRARAGTVGLQLGPVALRATVDEAEAQARRLTGRPPAAGRGDGGGELIACADAAHLRAILRHLMLAAASAAPEAGFAGIDVEASLGEARLLVHALAGVQRDELSAIEELVGGMGGWLRIGLGPAPSAQLVLRGLPCAAQLRIAA